MVAPIVRISIPHVQLAEFCGKWRIVEFSLFGSVLRDDFGPQSDVDVLVEFAHDARPGLFDLVRMEDELTELFGRSVDVLVKQSVVADENYLRRREILKNLCVIYDVGRTIPAGHADRGPEGQGLYRRD